MTIPYELPTVTAVVALVTWVVFVIRYHFSTGGAWRESAAGRNAMNSTFVIVGLLLLVVATRLARDGVPAEPFPGQRIAATVVYLGAVLSGAQRIVVQARAQRERKRQDAA